FRHHNPPYGFKVQNGKLVVNKQELKICRIVVDFMGRQKRPVREMAREFIRREIKKRRGHVKWGYLVVQQIFKRWNGKI
ncbi:MAG: hypothetical protein KDD22_02870, partial [Bdellovibrionales bacterium]|nr:hypothetical protein [Bdellovibrionales bacterium]